MAGHRSTLSNAADSLPGSGGGGGGGGGGGDPLRELFEACKTGDLAKVKALVNPKTVNARDTAGRKSTPLHFAAGESDTRHLSLISAPLVRTLIPRLSSSSDVKIPCKHVDAAGQERLMNQPVTFS